MRAFVIRGFDQKMASTSSACTEPIAPACRGRNRRRRHHQGHRQAGSIHEDMFRELVMADIVVADVSLHNANVFYELGIRHAVRPGRPC